VLYTSVTDIGYVCPNKPFKVKMHKLVNEKETQVRKP